LLFLAVLEADPEQMALTHARAGELFPVTFDDCTPTAAASPPGRPIEAGELDIDLIVAPGIGSAWRDRVAAFVEAARATFAEDDRRQLAAGFASYLQFAKGAAEKPRSPGALATRLVEAARLITRAQSEA
jgi:hypothetical protein